jgi:hypothetical protein
VSGDSKIKKSVQDSGAFTNSPLEGYEELAFRVIQKPSNKVAVTSHPRLKMHPSIFDIAVPRLGIPNSECAQHHIPWTAQYQRQLSTSTGIFRSACTQCSVPPDYRVPRTYAARPRECLIHHALATVYIAAEAGMTMQALLVFFVGLDGVTRVGRLKGVVTGQTRHSQKPLTTQPQRLDGTS